MRHGRATLIAIILCLSFAGPVSSQATVPVYKSLEPRPLPRQTSLADISIVAPDLPEWQQLARELSGSIASQGVQKPAVLLPDQKLFTPGWTGNKIIIGNLANNVQMARLYGLRLSYADAVYPGVGGYQLLTLVNPFGQGGNTIAVSASDLQGARLGIKKLLEIISEMPGKQIPWLFDVRLNDTVKAYFKNTRKPDREQLARQAERLMKALNPVKDNEVIADDLMALVNQIKIYGEYYQLTAEDAYGSMYRTLLTGYAAFLNKYPEIALNQLYTRRNMWVQSEKIIQNWMVLEADPIFSDSDRRQIISALFLTVKANSEDRYLVNPPAVAPRWNHEIFPAMSLIGSLFYFERFYTLPETSGWRKTAETIFMGNTSLISMDEGSDYLAHLPMVNIDYAMASGDLSYLDKRLRASADLHSMMIDNLGTLSGGGDTYPFGMSSAYSWGHSQVLNAASWYYSDPVYETLLERTRKGPFPGQRMPDLDYPIHRYIAKTTGDRQAITGSTKVLAHQLEKGLYDEVTRQDSAGRSVTGDRSFHKLVFRPGYSESDPYLIVDGFSAGKHGHQDGNAILNYSANGRLFLNDRDYIENTPEHHSGIVITKDGEQKKKPPLVRLDWVADLGAAGVSRSTVPGYNGADWQRTIASPDGRFYIIYDQLKFNVPGNYLVRNLWQSLGTASVRNGAFYVDQKGATMKLDNLGDAEMRTKSIRGHFIKYWKTVSPYPYADDETVLSEVLAERSYKAGEKAHFVNVLSSKQDNHGEIIAESVAENVIRITQGDSQWLAVNGSVSTDRLRSDGGFHFLASQAFIASGVTNISIGGHTFNFVRPVHFELETASGNWKTYDLLKDNLRYDEKGERIPAVALDSGKIGPIDLGPGFFEKLPVKKRPVAQSPAQPVRSGSLPGKAVFSAGAEITSSAAGDLNNDSKNELILAASSGKITAIKASGEVLWTFQSAGRVNEVSVQQLNGVPLVFVATENWHVHALKSNGDELWTRKIRDDQSRREYKGNLIGLTNVRVANLNGKNADPVVVVGTQFRYIYQLDPKGNSLSDTALYFYGIEDMEFADFDGDGKDEGVFALEYYYYAFRKGDKEIPGKTGGPGFKIAELVPGDAENRPLVLLGTKQSEVRMVGFDGKIRELWVKNVGGEVNDLRFIPGTGDILVGTEGFQFYVLDKSGHVKFRRTMQDRVTKTAAYTGAKSNYYLVATADQSLVQLDTKGRIVRSSQLRSPVLNILPGEDREPLIVLANGEVMRYTVPAR